MKKIYLSEIAKEFAIKEHVLRFYDAKGLTPFMRRDEHNYRYIEEEDKDWFRIINCLKQTGLPLREIKHYIDLVKIGAPTIAQRAAIIQKQKQAVFHQIEDLNRQLNYLTFKEDYYLKLLNSESSPE